jgi:hypothetical protein
MELLAEEKKRREDKFYTIEELDRLNTKRLLAFYKKERIKYFRFSGSIYCKCCGDLYAEINPDDEYYKKMVHIAPQWKIYVDKIKGLLNKREHVD